MSDVGRFIFASSWRTSLASAEIAPTSVFTKPRIVGPYAVSVGVCDQYPWTVAEHQPDAVSKAVRTSDPDADRDADEPTDHAADEDSEAGAAGSVAVGLSDLLNQQGVQQHRHRCQVCE